MMDLFSCRICLCSNKLKLCSLFLIKHGQSYAEMVEFSSGIVISENDCLPQNICTECLVGIETACEIKQKCIATDNLLRQQIKDEDGVEIKDEDEIKPEFLQNKPEDTNCVAFIMNFDVEQNTSKLNEIEDCLEDTRIKYSLDSEGESSEGPPVRKKSKPSFYAECSICSKVYYVKHYYEKHMKICHDHHENKTIPFTYQCFICNDTFLEMASKKRHILKEHRDLRHCSICNKKLITVLTLDEHIMHHKQKYNLVCHLCGQGFDTSHRLNQHMRDKHPSDDEKYCCDICGLEKQYKSKIKQHIERQHLQIRDFVCFVKKCKAKKFKTREELNLHQKTIHNRLRSNIGSVNVLNLINGGFQCTVCKLVFETRKAATIHDYEKHRTPKHCTICNKDFSSRKTLAKHQRTQHTNPSAFTCPICFKKFSLNYHLIVHTNTHTGAKPYSCNMCTYTSGDPSSVTKHKQKIHQLKNYKCDFCGMEFLQRKDYFQHRSIHTGI